MIYELVYTFDEMMQKYNINVCGFHAYTDTSDLVIIMKSVFVPCCKGSIAKSQNFICTKIWGPVMVWQFIQTQNTWILQIISCVELGVSAALVWMWRNAQTFTPCVKLCAQLHGMTYMLKWMTCKLKDASSSVCDRWNITFDPCTCSTKTVYGYMIVSWHRK